MEMAGDVPQSQRSMLTAMLAKPKGGYRPIGLFRCTHRVWSKVRKQAAAQVVTQNLHSSIFSMRPGQKCTDPIWRSQVTSVVSRGESNHIVEFDWDVQKCFEVVQRPILARLGLKHGWHPSLVRLSLGSYAWCRRLMDGHGLVSRKLCARHGVVAGSGFVLHELHTYMCDEAMEVLLCQPNLKLIIHVDDVAAEATGKTPRKAAEALEEGAFHLVHAFEDRLKLMFEPDKAFLLGSSKEVVSLAAKKLRNRAGCVVPEMRRLGVDHSQNGRTKNHVWKETWKTARARRVKMNKFSSKRHSPRKIFTCGVMPSLLFAAEVVLPPLKSINQARTWGLQYWPVVARGLSSDIGYQIIGVKFDPALLLCEKPLLRWAEEWYGLARGKSGELTAKVLAGAFCFEQTQYQPKLWKPTCPQTGSPVTYATLAAAMVGWSFKDANKLVDQNGRVLNMMEGSPGMLRYFYRRAWLADSLKYRLRRATVAGTRVATQFFTRSRSACRCHWFYGTSHSENAAYQNKANATTITRNLQHSVMLLL